MFNALTKKFSSLVENLFQAKKLTESSIHETLAQIHAALIDADVPLEVVRDFTQAVKQEALGKQIVAKLKPAEQLVAIMREKLVTFMGGCQKDRSIAQQPACIMLIGLQGAGKTSTIPKIAYYLKKESEKRGKQAKILCASVDFHRPAAHEQLAQLAGKVGASFYRPSTQEVFAAAQEICQQFKTNGYDFLLLDTAGRLHVDDAMVQELEKLRSLVKPGYTFLVIDSMVGQESLHLARSFDNNVGFDAAILTKMDSDTRGGVIFSLTYALKKPIQFITEGEKIDEISFFDVERMADRLLGYGDLQALAERADEKIKKADQEKAQRALAEGNFTLHDFAQQLTFMNQLGSLSSLLKYLPGSMNTAVSASSMQQEEMELKKCRAIMSSMNKKELAGSAKMSGLRKKQVAFGAGVTATDIDLLFQRFDQVKQYVKLFKKSGFMKNNLK